MKKLLIIAGLALGFPAAAQAQGYIEIRGGASWLFHGKAQAVDSAGAISAAVISFDTGWLAAVAAGRDFAGPLRAELEYSRRRLDVSLVTGSVANPTPPPLSISFTGRIPGSVTIDAVMLNGYADGPLGDGQTSLYIGVGAGAAFSDTKFDGIGQSETNFAFQSMIGLTYQATPKIAISAGYTIFVVDDIAFGNDAIGVTSHSLNAGVRMGF